MRNLQQEELIIPEELFSGAIGEIGFTQQVFDQLLDSRRIVVNEEITDDVMEKVTLQIMRFNKEDNDAGIKTEERIPIVLYINSDGGSVYDGMSVINTIESSKTPVYGVAFKALSMGAYIFISTHKRYAFKDSIIMLHDGEVGLANSTSKAVDTVQWMSKLFERIQDMVQRKSNITQELLINNFRKEWFLFGDEAKEYGLVDTVIGSDGTLEDIL